MPRLLFVIDDDSYFCWHRMDLGRAARDAGFEVAVATRVQNHAKPIEDEGFNLLPIRLRRGIQSPPDEWAAFIELIRLYRREQPDIIHHFALKQVLFGAVAARITGVPAVVNTITGLGYMFQGGGGRRRLIRSVITPALRWALAHPQSSVIFENGDDCQDFLNERLVKHSQAVVIRGAGVNVSQFSPAPEPSGVPVVLLVARMVWDKGVGEFVQAARLLKAKGIHARFVLVGSVDPDNPTSISEADLMGWEKDGIVEWWGHRENMPEAYASSHVVVLPSYGEGLPKTLLEAAACARPLVATDVRGCREIARNGDNGFLVPLKEAEPLAHAIATLLDDRTLRAKMGTRSREIVEKEFRAELIANATITLYRRLLERTRSASVKGGVVS